MLLQGALGLSGTVGAPGVAGQQVTGNKTLRLNCRCEYIMYIVYISDEPTVQFKGLLLLFFFPQGSSGPVGEAGDTGSPGEEVRSIFCMYLINIL